MIIYKYTSLVVMSFRHCSVYLGLLGLVLLGGCGGGGSSQGDTPTEEQIQSASQLNRAKNDAEFTAYLKDGLKNTTKTGGYIEYSPEILSPVVVDAVAESALDSAEAAGDAVAGFGEFSSTNVIEEGVDEADFMKFDGEILYVVEQPSRPIYWVADDGLVASDEILPFPEIVGSVQLFKTTSSPAGTEAISKIDVASSNETVTGIYLHGERDSGEASMVSVSTRRHYGWTFWANESAWTRGVTRVQITDVSDPYAPAKKMDFSWHGYYVDSRRVGNTLYVISRFTPYLIGLEFWPSTLDVEANNNQLIDDATLADLLPALTISSPSSSPSEDVALQSMKSTVPLLGSGDCFLTPRLSTHDHSASIITITAINLDSLQAPSSVCTPAFNGGLYASTSSLYLNETYGHSGNQKTAIHKFDISAEKVAYRGSGSVTGNIGWRGASFRMSEYKDQLRVISTSYSSDWSPRHRLTILEEAQDTVTGLKTVAELPNKEEPSPIGKPNDEIYAVRFFADKGYVVTFERIDPLYILDLKDSLHPKIAGELEVPGFSTYLQLLDQDTLLGIGTINNLPQVSVFDVSDASNPSLADVMIWDGIGTTTAASYDYKAVTYLHDMESQSTRLVLPMVKRENWSFVSQGAQLLEIDRSTMEIFDDGFMGVLDNIKYGKERSVIHDNAVHYINGSSVWSADWDKPNQFTGPTLEIE